MRILRVLVLFVGALAAPAGSQTALLQVSPQRYLAHVKFLASDELEGRGNGTPGLERAADYIAGEFAKAGLAPAGDAGTYFQSFTLGPRLQPTRGPR